MISQIIAVFWILDGISSQIIEQSHIFYKTTMGACLSVQNRQKLDEIPREHTQPHPIRALIAQQLKQSTFGNLPPPSSQLPVSSISSRKIILPSGPQIQPDCKVKIQEVPTGNLGKEKIDQSQLTNFASKKDGNVSLQDMNEESILHSNESQEQEDQQESNQGQQNSEEQNSIEQQTTQTPFNRVSTSLKTNQVGRGLTENDNKLISSTLSSKFPVRLEDVKLKNKSIYKGEWLQAQRHGQGVLRWKDGSSYSGKWLNNCSHGQGKLTFADGSMYLGEFVNNRAEGKGVSKYADGSQYQGQWKNNEKDGHGVLRWGDGERYEGQWLANKKHGQGQMYFNDGSYYKGEFNSNEIHGTGRYMWINSKDYVGQWEHNQMSGHGKLVWSNGQQFEGRFSNNKYQGQGTMTLADGSSSTGNWEKGRKHGVFEDKDCAGRVSQTEWYLGKKMKQAEQHEGRGTHRKRSDESKGTSIATETV